MYIILRGIWDCPPQTGIVHGQVIVISIISFYFVEKNESQFSMLGNKSGPPLHGCTLSSLTGSLRSSIHSSVRPPAHILPTRSSI